MKMKDKVQVIFIMLVLVELVCITTLTFKLKDLYKRVNDLEKDYKIYELNLQNLEENKEVQFDYNIK